MSAGATLVDLAEVVRALVMPVEPGEREICVACRAFIHEPNDTVGRCENCIQNAESLGVDVTPILPITLYHRESETRTWITHYKPDVDDQHGEPVEDQKVCSAVVAELVGQFLHANAWLLQDVDRVIVVPSTRRRPPHPLEVIVRQSAAADLLLEAGLTRTAEALDHRKANPLAYQGSEALAGQRIMLIDDVYASGARLQSAAVAASRVGAQIVRSVVIARRINPAFHPVIQAKWDEAMEATFSWARVPQESKTIASSSLTALADIAGSD